MRKAEPQYPKWRHTTPVLLDAEVVRTAEGQIAACEFCAPDKSEVPFEYILDCVTGYDPEYTDYILSEAAQCPSCGANLLTGYSRWCDSEEEVRTLFILPGTLVALKERIDNQD
jgi:hypothetical protein